MKTTNTRRKATPEILTSDVMRRIEYIDRSLFSLQEQLHMDLFMFSYYAGGMSLQDMAHLTADRIDGEFLNCDAIACPKCLKLRMSTQFLEILDRYKDQVCGDYLLPIFTPKHDAQAKQEARLKQMATSVSKTLLKIEAITGCRGLTWHGARQAHVDFRLRQGNSVVSLGQMIGDTVLEVDKYYWDHPELTSRLPYGMNNMD